VSGRFTSNMLVVCCLDRRSGQCFGGCISKTFPEDPSQILNESHSLSQDEVKETNKGHFP